MDERQPSFWLAAPRQSIRDIIAAKFWDILGQQSSANHRSATPRKLAGSGDDAAKLPAGCQVADPANADADLQVTAFLQFLHDHYNTNSRGAPPISTLNAKQVADLYLRPILCHLPASPGSQPSLAGCISSQPAGRICRSATCSAFPIRLITNFCVHPNFRKKGVGSRLLQAAWADIKQLGEAAAIFLKEGSPLLAAGLPIASGRWVYRFCTSSSTVAAATQICQIAPADAEHLLIDYAASEPRNLYNFYGSLAACQTRLYEYKGMRGSILTAFTPAFQHHPSNRRPIVYQTGFYEKGQILEQERLAAARAISEYVGSQLGGAWIWCDISFINGRAQPPWLLDGPYYYYAFNWEPGPGICGNARLFLRI
jgi:hypothetical protein